MEPLIDDYIRKRWARGPDYADLWLRMALKELPYRALRAAGKTWLFPEKNRTRLEEDLRGHIESVASMRILNLLEEKADV